MDKRLTQEQLTQIIAEVERLSQRRQQELDPEQVKEILQELSLPPELFDEALIQLRRQEALVVQQKRNRWIAAGVLAALAIGIGSISLFVQQNQQILSRVSAQQDRITLLKDDGNNLKTIFRQANPEVFYRVTLKDAPVGKKLSLSCDWIDPNGQVMHQNRYQTRETYKSIWNTYCRYRIVTATPIGNWKVKMFLEDHPNRIVTATPIGNWKVKMFLEDHPISDTSFEVK